MDLGLIKRSDVARRLTNAEVDGNWGAVQAGFDALSFESALQEPYAAAGNNVSDDAAALQAFLTANAGKTCLIPAATYKCLAGLTVPPKTTVFAFGAKLNFAGAGNISAVTLGADAALIGLELEGPGNATYVDASRGIVCVGTNNSPAAPTYVDGPKVLFCKAAGFAGYGFFGQYLRGGSVDKSAFLNCGYAGVALLSCAGVSTDGNRIDGIGPGSAGGDAYGIFFDRQDAGLSETTDPRSSHIKCRYNYIANVASSSGNNGQAIDTHGGVDCVVHGNTIENCEVGIAITASSISGAQALGPKRVSVSSNVIKGAKVGYGILVSGAITGSTTVVDYAEDITLLGNIIDGHGVAGSATTGAITAQGTKRLVISGGSVARPAVHGIHLGINNLGFRVHGVSVLDPHDNVAATCAAVHIGGNNNKGTVSGITATFEDGGLATNVAVNCVRVAAGLTGLDVKLRSFDLQGIDATHLNYSEATSAGMDISGMVVQTARVVLSGGVYAWTFPRRMPVAAPRVMGYSCTANETIRFALPTATGLSVTSSNAASTATVDVTVTT